jgi:hypothetical protein
MKLINKLEKRWPGITRNLETWLRLSIKSSMCPFGYKMYNVYDGAYLCGCDACKMMFPELTGNKCPCSILGVKGVAERCKSTLEGDI